MRCDVELVGKTPILMHKDSIEWADHMDAWRKDPANRNISKPGDDRSPAFTWIGSLYHDGENVCMPCELLMACLRKGGSRVIVKRQTTAKEVTQTGLFLECGVNADFFCKGKKVSIEPIMALATNNAFAEHLEAVKKIGFDLDGRRAKIGKAKHIRIRPRFNNWSVKFGCEITDPSISKDLFSMVMEQSGKVGLGDWRPGCSTPGQYGQFVAKVDWK